MLFNQRLQSAVLVRRYKRFLADVKDADGRQITVHCPNSGSMLGCSTPGSTVMISISDNPKRKYPHTLEMIKIDSTWIGINTSRTNQIVREAIESGIVTEIGKVDQIHAEVKTSAKTRLDFMLEKNGRKIYVEVKNCSLVLEGCAMFPDAKTVRGTKHLNELLALKKEGHGAAVIFCVQSLDAFRFSPAGHIDPEYAQTLAKAYQKGVLVLAYQASVDPQRIEIIKKLPVEV